MFANFSLGSEQQLEALEHVSWLRLAGIFLGDAEFSVSFGLAARVLGGREFAGMEGSL